MTALHAASTMLQYLHIVLFDKVAGRASLPGSSPQLQYAKPRRAVKKQLLAWSGVEARYVDSTPVSSGTDQDSPNPSRPPHTSAAGARPKQQQPLTVMIPEHGARSPAAQSATQAQSGSNPQRIHSAASRQSAQPLCAAGASPTERPSKQEKMRSTASKRPAQSLSPAVARPTKGSSSEHETHSAGSKHSPPAERPNQRPSSQQKDSAQPLSPPAERPKKRARISRAPQPGSRGFRAPPSGSSSAAKLSTSVLARRLPPTDTPVPQSLQVKRPRSRDAHVLFGQREQTLRRLIVNGQSKDIPAKLGIAVEEGLKLWVSRCAATPDATCSYKCFLSDRALAKPWSEAEQYTLMTCVEEGLSWTESAQKIPTRSESSAATL